MLVKTDTIESHPKLRETGNTLALFSPESRRRDQGLSGRLYAYRGEVYFPKE